MYSKVLNFVQTSWDVMYITLLYNVVISNMVLICVQTSWDAMYITLLYIVAMYNKVSIRVQISWGVMYFKLPYNVAMDNKVSILVQTYWDVMYTPLLCILPSRAFLPLLDEMNATFCIVIKLYHRRLISKKKLYMANDISCAQHCGLMCPSDGVTLVLSCMTYSGNVSQPNP